MSLPLGPLHGANEGVPWSIEHSKVVLASEAWKENVGMGSVRAGGADSMVVSGPVASTMYVASRPVAPTIPPADLSEASIVNVGRARPGGG